MTAAALTAILGNGKFFAVVSDRCGWLQVWRDPFGNRPLVRWGSPFGNLRLFRGQEEAKQMAEETKAPDARVVVVVVHD